MTRRPTRRAGTSLLEVLVGLGIMAVGAISVFVLFPFSAINVSKAMIDDRTTTCAITADNDIRAIHQRSVVEPESRAGQSSEPYHWAMDNRQPPPNQTQPIIGAPSLGTTDPGPSYPVFVDPQGVAARAGRPNQNVVGDTGLAMVPRVDLRLISGNKDLALRFCSQMDGLTFDEGGHVPGGIDMRELRYNWLWVLQRPSNRDRHTVRQQVVVFDKRAHLFAPPGSEAEVTANFIPGDTAITNVPLVNALNEATEVRKGTWIMDAGDPVNQGLRHAEFYRVVSVNEVTNGTVTTLSLEVHKPVSRPDGLNGGYVGRLIILPGVADVYERPVLTGDTGP